MRGLPKVAAFMAKLTESDQLGPSERLEIAAKAKHCAWVAEVADRAPEIVRNFQDHKAQGPTVLPAAACSAACSRCARECAVRLITAAWWSHELNALFGTASSLPELVTGAGSSHAGRP